MYICSVTLFKEGSPEDDESERYPGQKLSFNSCLLSLLAAQSADQ